MLKKLLIGMGVIVFALGLFVFNTLVDAGLFREIEPHFNGTCSTINGVVGVEDITVDRTTGLAYLSSHDRRSWRDTDPYKTGAIYIYRVGSESTPLEMPHDLDAPLAPHGISLWKNPVGPDRLFVVNHPSEERDGRIEVLSHVEIFEIADGALHHIRTLKTDGAYSLNDVVAIDGEHFYASIDKGSETPFGRMLESYARLARGGIAYGSSTGITRVAGDLIFPNGLQLSPDGKTLYVAETTGERFLTYERDPATNALTLVDEMPIDSGLDNMEWDSNGDLWIGAHPRTIDFVEHAKEASNRSPSQVLKVSIQNGTYDVEELYLDDGNPISGSTVGAPYGDRFLIGSVYEPFILDCKRDVLARVAP